MNLTAKEIVDIITPFLTLGGIAFMIYKTFRQPDIDIEKEMAVFKESCKLKHQGIDNDIWGIKENHLKHLEVDVSQIKLDIMEIKTMLNERLPKK